LKNLLQRTLSGIIYLIVIIGSLFLGKYAFGAIFLGLGILALSEYYHLQGIPFFGTQSIPGLLTGAVAFILSFLVAARLTPPQVLTILLVIPVLFFVFSLYAATPAYNHNLPVVITGVIYVMTPLSLLNFLAFPVFNQYGYTHRLVLGILLLVWINDTAAYVTGSVFGWHRLFERISPKKSWEGFIGGTFFTLAAAWWMNLLMGIAGREHWLVLAGIVSVFGVYGDLSESLMKRNAGIKDSGNLIPGHGGVLDRVDSLLFAVPLSFLYLLFFAK
jgi:phosphatidate cytidylyltransferase